jgi:hypothetical protein
MRLQITKNDHLGVTYIYLPQICSWKKIIIKFYVIS